jgi:hypothetical protein
VGDHVKPGVAVELDQFPDGAGHLEVVAQKSSYRLTIPVGESRQQRQLALLHLFRTSVVVCPHLSPSSLFFL